MRARTLFLAAPLALLLAQPAHARESCGHLAAVHSLSGATACVAQSAWSKFQAFVRDLESTGYRIAFMGGWRAHGSVRHSLHPSGLALDIDQTARNRTTHRLPSDATEIAARHGLLHGAVWSHADAGHFQVVGSTVLHERQHARRYVRHRHLRHHRRYAWR